MRVGDSECPGDDHTVSTTTRPLASRTGRCEAPQIATAPAQLAYVSLGSNLGDRRENLNRALKLLDAPPHLKLRRFSSFIETPPVDCPPGSPAFLNAAAEIQTSLSPRELLARLLEIEAAMGRRRAGEPKNAPRLIDLDLLLFDQRVIAEPGLVIPHPRMHQRLFVLIPLAQIAAEARHPLLGRSIGEMLADLRRTEAVKAPDRAADESR